MLEKLHYMFTSIQFEYTKSARPRIKISTILWWWMEQVDHHHSTSHWWRNHSSVSYSQWDNAIRCVGAMSVDTVPDVPVRRRRRWVGGVVVVPEAGPAVVSLVDCHGVPWLGKWNIPKYDPIFRKCVVDEDPAECPSRYHRLVPPPLLVLEWEWVHSVSSSVYPVLL